MHTQMILSIKKIYSGLIFVCTQSEILNAEECGYLNEILRVPYRPVSQFIDDVDSYRFSSRTRSSVSNIFFAKIIHSPNRCDCIYLGSFPFHSTISLTLVYFLRP